MKSYIVGVEFQVSYVNRVDVRVAARTKAEARKRVKEVIANGEIDYDRAYQVGDSWAGTDRVVDVAES